VSLDEVTAAGSGGIADGIRAAMVEEVGRSDVALRLLGGAALKVRAGRLGSRLRADRTEERVLPGATVLRVPSIRSADVLQREKETKSLGWKIDDRKRWYDLPEEVDGGT